MKRIALMLFFIFIAHFLYGQNLKDIFEKYIANRGSYQKLSQITTLNIEGEYRSSVTEQRKATYFSYFFKRGNIYIQECKHEVSDRGMIICSDGIEEVTIQGTRFNKNKPANYPLIDDLTDAYLTSQENKFTYESIELVGGKICYLLKSDTYKSGQTLHYYLDTLTYLPILFKSAYHHSGLLIEEYWSDYQWTDGLLYPFTQRMYAYVSDKSKSSVFTDVSIKRVIINPKLPDDFFDCSKLSKAITKE